MKEPVWIQSIDSNSVCTWFYAFFIINSIFAALAILSIGALMFKVSMVPRLMFMPSLLSAIVAGGVAVVNSLFFYIVCQRAIASD
jgi:hypothetical protein